jgi:Na+/proline symporter
MFNPDVAITASLWSMFALVFAHIPLGMLPHIGNKLWALKSDRDQKTFIIVSFTLGMLLPALAFGGILARAILGNELLADGASANDAIPALFIATLPTWLAALVGSAVLAAVMSTADGLVVSTSQIFANDIFRRTIAPRYMQARSEKDIDRYALNISRIATILVLALAIWLAWSTRDMNVALLIWAGVGGMMAASAGPIFCGVLWRGATKSAAITGFFAGGLSFIALKSGWISQEMFVGGPLEAPGTWLASQSVNPFACATIGSFVSVGLVIALSQFTKPPSEAHLERVFGS